MATLVLVRHGQAAAGWDADSDPALDDIGRAQAEAVAEVIASGPVVPILTSPLRRTRETAAPLERLWGSAARTTAEVGEVPSPTADLAARGAWLRGIMGRRWSELDDGLNAWRRQVIARLLAEPGDRIVFTHFIAINAAVGSALGEDRVLVFNPDYCSRTVLSTDGRCLRVIERGAEGRSRVL